MDNETIELYRPLYNSILEKPLIILGLFQEQFGEENVELQGVRSLEEFSTYCTRQFSSVERASMCLGTSTANSIIRKPVENMPDSNMYIIVRFPQVRVTNENYRYVDITGLWVRVTVNLDGTTNGRFKMLRTEYSFGHWISDYAHSHLPGIATVFKEPCTGRGPINRTIDTCITSFDEDFWRLYCYELSLFVKVESLEGVPHRKLESIVSNLGNTVNYSTEGRYPDVMPHIRDSYYLMVLDFIRYLIKKQVLKFSFVGGAFNLGMSYKEERIFISNQFIEWYNLPDNPWKTCFPRQSLLNGHFLNFYKIDNDRLKIRAIGQANSTYTSRANQIPRYQDLLCFRFKGEEVRLHIQNPDSENSLDTFESILADNHSILVNKNITDFIVGAILRFLNGTYGNKTKFAITNRTSGGEEASPAQPERGLFIY